MPMSLHTHPMPDDQSVVALMYGPLVLAGRLGSEGLTTANVHTTQNWYKFPPAQIATAPPLSVVSDNINDWIEPVPGKPLTFRTIGQYEEITLIPYHKLFNQKYIIYWKVLKDNS
jgi:DUF1680 family protein